MQAGHRKMKEFRGVVWTRAVTFAAALLAPAALAQQAFTWAEIKDKFAAGNPALQAARLTADESRAAEITAYLRPNPTVTATLDQIDPFTPNPYRPLGGAFPLLSGNYLHERGGKRELRRDSAQQATQVAESNRTDIERNLLFNLRTAFVQVLQQKAVLQLARENLSYYDSLLTVNRDRFKAGDIAEIDMTRLELQRVQYETDLQNATVALRQAKIQLLQFLNDRTPVEQFDVNGPFEFREQIQPLEEFQQMALDTRPDLKAASQGVEKAKTDHRLAIANGSVDPTFGVDVARNPPIPAYFGASVTIPLRIFDRNQGEKARTEIEIHRTERALDSAQAQVIGDVRSAYATLMSTLNLLRPYQSTYLAQALKIRETVSFMYQHGAASLLDFRNAQNDYRSTYLNYVNLIGSHLNAANQLNLAVGREAIQ